MKLVEHIFEPKRLLLAWQAPEGLDRTRFIVGELQKHHDNVTFRYTSESEDFEKAQRLGFRIYPAFKHTNVEYREGVLETFMRRLPPKSRRDFGRYLELYRLPKDQSISDFGLLGYTGAKLPTDGFSIVNPFDGLSGPCEFLLEIAGFRYLSNLSPDELHIGDPVAIKPDDKNKYDPNAVMIEYKGKTIGYVNRGLCATFRHWIKERYKISGTLERINGHPVRPLVFVFVKVRPEKRKA